MIRESDVKMICTLFAAAAVSAALATSAAATVLVPVDLNELTREAATIVRGRVVTADGRWTADHRSIETLVTLDVDSYLKGERQATAVQFTVPGGRVGRLHSIFVGAPQFSAGDRVIVFLGSRPPAMLHVLGLSQGVFRVVPAAGGGWLVTPPPILATGSTTAPIVRGDVSRRPMPLDAFEREVQALRSRSPIRGPR